MIRAYCQSIVLVLILSMLCMNTVYGKSYCGSTLMQRIGVPEYVCFGLTRIVPYAGCAVGRLSGYKPVYFGEACRAHDDCYGMNGISKEYCDKQFLTLLQITCDTTLTGKFRKISRKKCFDIATVYYHAVRIKGHEAFANAQRLSMQKNPASGSERSLRQQRYGREFDEDMNEAARDFERGVNEAARDFQRGVNEAASEWR